MIESKERVEHRIGNRLIVEMKVGDTSMFCPFIGHSKPEVENWFGYSLEEALLAQLWYEARGKMPYGDLVWYTLLDHLGVSPLSESPAHCAWTLSVKLSEKNGGRNVK